MAEKRHKGTGDPVKMYTVAISLGGSILSTERGFNVKYARAFSEVVKRHSDKKFVVSVGGGHLAKETISLVSDTVGNKLYMDEIGIAATRFSALVLKNVMKSYGIDANDVIPTNLDDFKELHVLHRVTVFGGFVEGVTTDTDAMLAAEASYSDALINIGTMPYIYDRNPSEPGAKKLPKLNYQELLSLAREADKRSPGTRFIFDYVATLLALRSKTKLIFVDDKIEDLEAALNGQTHNGSVVQ